MAVLPFDLDEEERKRQETAAGGNGQMAGAPQSSPGGTPGGGDSPAGGSPQSKGTSGWTDINTYLDANKEQAIGTADKIAGRLGEQASGIRTDIDTAGQNFKKRVDDSTIRDNSDLEGRAAADPLAFSKNDSDVAALKKMRDASYGGPSSFQEADEYTGLLGKIDEANLKAKGVDSESGREALLAGIMKNPTKGMTSLDNLLIGANPDARSRLSAAAKPFEDLNSYLDSIGQGATSYAGAGQKTTADTATGVRTTLEGTKGRLNTELDKRTADAKAAAVAASTAAQNKLKNFRTEGGKLTADDLAILGITPEQAKDLLGSTNTLKNAGAWKDPATGQNAELQAEWMAGSPDFYNVNFDPSNFSTMLSPDAQITRGNAASQEDYQRIAALEGLMGSPSGLLNQNDVGQAGSATKDLLDFRGGEATGNAKELLKQKDRQTAAFLSGLGYGAPVTDEQLVQTAKNKPFYDSVMTGKTMYHSSNPKGNARGIMAIKALARLGFYQMPPGSIYSAADDSPNPIGTPPDAGVGGEPTPILEPGIPPEEDPKKRVRVGYGSSTPGVY